MGKYEKTAYEAISAIAGMALAFSLAALFFSHFQIQELNTTTGELERMFSESAQEEHELMSTVRVVSAVITASVIAVLFAISPRYYALVDDPKWEIKKGIIGGLFNVVLGIIFFIWNPDLLVKSIGLAVMTLGVFIALGNSIYLSVKFGGDSSAKSGAYCASCGSAITKTDSFCPDCGTEL